MLTGTGADKVPSGLACRQRHLNGAGGNDTLDGGMGSDLLTGSAGADVFVSSDGQEGSDDVTDVHVGIVHLQINGASSVPDLTFTAQGQDVRLSFGTVSVLVEHVSVAPLQDPGNFIFA